MSQSEAKPENDEENMPPAVMWTLAIAGHLALTVLLAIPLGFTTSIFVVVFAALVEVGVWQRVQLIELFRSKLPERSSEAMIYEPPPPLAAQRPADSEQIFTAEAIEPISPNKSNSANMPSVQPTRTAPASRKERPSAPKEPKAPVEITLKSEVVSSIPRTSSQPIPPPAQTPRPPAAPVRRSSLTARGAVLPEDQIRFFGPGTVLNLGRGALRGPLVYATAKPNHGAFDASLIDGSLDVAPPGAKPVESLPYWPSYDRSAPEQRSQYLDWLTSGRCEPNIELGYVFIYFYGLERRILVDGADHLPIIEELLRLRRIYTNSRSFDRYSASLLWLSVALLGPAVSAAGIIDAVLESTGRWDEEVTARCLSYFYTQGQRLPTRVAYQVAKHDNRTPSSVIIRRHAEKFEQLFVRKYDDAFPGGMELKASKRNRPLQYHPASATLLGADGSARQALDLPDVLGIASQFKPLINLWEECIYELRSFDKATNRSNNGELTAAAFEALPEALRSGEHPEFDEWFRLWEVHANPDGLPVVPIEALAAVKRFSRRETLLKSQCAQLLATADCLGIGVEPDARLTGKNYGWDDRVVLFFRESQEQTNSATYQGATLLLELGASIAYSDGHLDDRELSHISQHVADQFALTADESKRLECRTQLLRLYLPSDARISTAVKKKLDQSQRKLIGEYLVGVAAADQHISPAEMALLRRLYVQLDLDPKELQSLIAPSPATSAGAGTKEIGAAKDEFYLDLGAVSRIMNETKEVARFLQEAMADEADDTHHDSSEEELVASDVLAQAIREMPAPQAPVSAEVESSSNPVEGDLARRFHPFMHALVTKSEWGIPEARQLAATHQVMLQGAIEAINEWSQDRFGDWLIEEGDTLLIHSELLNK